VILPPLVFPDQSNDGASTLSTTALTRMTLGTKMKHLVLLSGECYHAECRFHYANCGALSGVMLSAVMQNVAAPLQLLQGEIQASFKWTTTIFIFMQKSAWLSIHQTYCDQLKFGTKI
jgi:hypothetical protein